MPANHSGKAPFSPQSVVWKFILEKKKYGTEVVLLYVLESRGSSPGRQGFRMAVAADNTFCGSIGGGIMEHKFVELAKSRLQARTRTDAVFRQVHDKNSSDQSGMICSGEQTIFLYEVDDRDLNPLQDLLDSLNNHDNGCLILRPDGIEFSQKKMMHNFVFEQKEHGFMLEEKTGHKNIIHIIGGGHCALAFSKLMNDLDFYVVVYDEREGLNTMQENIYAHEKKVVPAYENLNEMIEGGDNVYAVIMTFGYRTDDIAFRSLASKEFKYFGLLGSGTKIEKMFSEYRREGMDEAILKKVHAPIGINIKSQTTTEIAVSIAAEIISVKNQDQ